MSLFNIIGTIIVGAIAGYLASIIVGTNKNQGCLADIVVGVVGGFIGSFVQTLVIPGGIIGGIADTIIFATVGAVILLFVLQAFRPRRRRRRR